LFNRAVTLALPRKNAKDNDAPNASS